MFKSPPGACLLAFTFASTRETLEISYQGPTIWIVWGDAIVIRVTYIISGTEGVLWGRPKTRQMSYSIMEMKLSMRLSQLLVITLSDFLVDCEIARDTDAGHARAAEYMTSKVVSHLNDAVEHFQLLPNQCSDHSVAFTNLAHARL
ncbi:hypothetical protein EDD22DRAFT_842867 [Suillus occidentalis]|nr:hypothetical protein EDD22DRAFT_842867 [Suillus occidentalis]